MIHRKKDEDSSYLEMTIRLPLGLCGIHPDEKNNFVPNSIYKTGNRNRSQLIKPKIFAEDISLNSSSYQVYQYLRKMRVGSSKEIPRINKKIVGKEFPETGRLVFGVGVGEGVVVGKVVGVTRRVGVAAAVIVGEGFTGVAVTVGVVVGIFDIVGVAVINGSGVGEI